jgi:MATE family, multidrug efflux pump
LALSHIPLVFGLGAPLVALLGTNIGAGQRERALRIAFVGAGTAFLITSAIGVALIHTLTSGRPAD